MSQNEFCHSLVMISFNYQQTKNSLMSSIMLLVKQLNKMYWYLIAIILTGPSRFKLSIRPGYFLL